MASEWVSSFPGFKSVQSLGKKAYAGVLRTGPVPRHIGFIMDGNRRYARRRNIELKEGHNAGFESMARTLETCYDCGVECATVFAFSVENFNRSAYEVEWLMELFKHKFSQIVEHGDMCEQYGIRVRVLGDIELLPNDVIKVLRRAEQITEKNTRAVLNVCFAYTARHDIRHSIQQTISQVVKGELDSTEISEQTLESNLYTGGLPPLELLIRTSGVHRLSDFLLWECHTSTCDIEIVDTLWPEFGVKDICWILLKWSFNRMYGRKLQGVEARDDLKGE
ncbi:unnamed protein product [Kuraishia capsulata CBS 1993]|uniref:Alkyl transferase n=1 Tax=Kuraishia capsulata CBS 1993 TaxID=1382522 RepID=W6MV71_9ASCO|nr:uncharacterized protein KUCA_T00005795001 [Kuraishia capsulata CBS 1993]CDK29802.1 unnamed protein product [Kuraishia capsulata CBS 1993]